MKKYQSLDCSNAVLNLQNRWNLPGVQGFFNSNKRFVYRSYRHTFDGKCPSDFRC